jgi:replicative DNA helicase
MTCGFRPGELIILAALAGDGKTALALNVAQHVAMNPTNPRAVAVFSLEMSSESLLQRMVCAQARVSQTSSGRIPRQRRTPPAAEGSGRYRQGADLYQRQLDDRPDGDPR